VWKEVDMRYFSKFCGVWAGFFCGERFCEFKPIE
jgi:hypothetical protein